MLNLWVKVKGGWSDDERAPALAGLQATSDRSRQPGASRAPFLRARSTRHILRRRPATYVLHSRPYRNQRPGLLHPVGSPARVSARRPQPAGALARLFVPLEADGARRTEDRGPPESAGIPQPAHGQALFSGLYLNELLIRLLPAEDPQPEIFAHYAATLLLLAAGRPIEPLLSAFEWRPLEQLGYGFASMSTSMAPDRAAGVNTSFEAGLEPVAQLQPGLFQGSGTVIHGRRRLERPPAPWRRPSA